MRVKQRVGGQHRVGIAFAAQDEQPELGLVQPQMQDRVVQFARQQQRPE